jgi:hypothetical protein
MKKKLKQPLMHKTHLPLVLLGAAMALYGLVAALVGSWFSNQAMRGLITAGAYRSKLSAFDATAGLLAGIIFFVLFIICAVNASSRGARAAAIIGTFASFAPMLAGRAENLLFKVMGLPTMNAGSVIAGAFTTIIFALPMTIMFIVLASSGRVPRGIRWLALLSIFIVLGTAFFPIYVTVLAFLLKPGDPAVGRMIEVSTQVIKMRYLLPGLSLLLMAWISLRFSHKQAAEIQTRLGDLKLQNEAK